MFAEIITQDLNQICISENVLSMQYAYQYKKDGLCRFAVVMDGISGWPVFERGNLMIIDTRSPITGDYVLATCEQGTVPCKYFKVKEGFQLWIDNRGKGIIEVKNNNDTGVIGVIVELRKYF